MDRIVGLALALALVACGGAAGDEEEDLGSAGPTITRISDGDFVSVDVRDSPYQVLDCRDVDGVETCDDITDRFVRVAGELCYDADNCGVTNGREGGYAVVYRW